MFVGFAPLRSLYEVEVVSVDAKTDATVKVIAFSCLEGLYAFASIPFFVFTL